MFTAFEQLPKSRSAAIIAAGVEEFSKHSYSDANTDRITAGCGISKGLLYHYFGTKKSFYLYCLEYALDALTRAEALPPAGDFYEILFAGMEQKMRQCAEHPAETKLLNIASRELSREVKGEKDALFGRYAAQLQARSDQVMETAIAALKLRKGKEPLAARGLKLYASALINRYLLLYQNTPEEFFSRQDAITREMKAYLDLMLTGICEEET